MTRVSAVPRTSRDNLGRENSPMIESDRMLKQVSWLDRTAKLALIGGFMLPPVVVGILIARGWPLGALGGIILVGWWFSLGLFLLLRAASLWQSKKTYPENDPKFRHIRFRAVIYTTLCVLVVMVPLSLFLFCCVR